MDFNYFIILHSQIFYCLEHFEIPVIPEIPDLNFPISEAT